jgi:hypothetical protein
MGSAIPSGPRGGARRLGWSCAFSALFLSSWLWGTSAQDLPASWTPEQIQRLDRSASIVASGVPSPLEVQRLVAAACEGGAAELAGLWETYQELASVVRETGGEGQR